jgi:hypothetical protein
MKAEIVIAENTGKQVDQVGGHRGMIEVGEVRVLCIVPVIGLLRRRAKENCYNRPD